MAGGTKGYGTVYKLSPGPAGEWKEKILLSFTGGVSGSQPWAGVTLDAAGNIYGTTISTNVPRPVAVVYELKPEAGKGRYNFRVLWHFVGLLPYASVILDNTGNLYGTGGGYVESGLSGILYEVNPLAPETTTILSSSPNPSTYGQTVTFTAAVTSSASGVPPDGETVSFRVGKTALGTEALSGGTATFTISALGVGEDSVTAAYGGDLDFRSSKSKPLKQVVKKAGSDSGQAHHDSNVAPTRRQLGFADTAGEPNLEWIITAAR